MATEADIPLLVSIGFQFLPKTPYKNMVPDAASVIEWLTGIIATGVCILIDEDSFICGVTLKLPFSSTSIAAELMWGSLKQNLNRRARAEKELLEAFEYWARNVAEVEAIQIGSFHGDKFLQKRGYERCETLYLARLK